MTDSIDQEKTRLDESRLRQSDELFHIQVEGVKDYAIFMLDAQGNVLNWNAGAERLKGYRDDEIIGKHFSCFYPEEDRNAGKPEEQLKMATTEGRVEDVGWRIRKDGSRFWADVIITALHDESGNLRGFSKVTRDITERKQAVEALQESEKRYRTLFTEIDEGFCIIEMIFDENERPIDYRFLETNPSFEKQTEIKDAQGKRIRELAPKHGEHWFETFGKIALTGQPARFLSRAEQLHRWYDVYAFRFGQPQDRQVAVLFNDITERKQAEEEREQLLVQLEAILNSINEGVAVSDLEGNVLIMNPSALAIHEFESIEQVRMPLHQYQEIFELSDLDGNPVLFEQWPLSRATRGERFADYEVRVRRKDTGKSWIGSYSGTPVRTRAGDFILSVITMRDITERKRTEAELERLASYPIMNPNPVLELNADGHMTYCNPAAKIILEDAGYNCSINPLIPPDLPIIFQEMQDKKTEKYFRIVEINGRYFEELIYVAPTFQSFRIYTMDITERKRAEEEIERLNVELEAANKELEAFNYSVAHDLRKPLTVINGYCQALMELCSAKIDDQCKKYIREAYDGTLRMDGLITALLNFSRLSHVEPRRETVEISTMALTIAAELKLTEPDRRVEFRIADGIRADGDAALLRVVLDNLLGNAWKYTGMQDEAVIEFGEIKIEGESAYFVRDNGAGFNAEDMDKLFLPFQRLHGSEQFKGFGIGLTTVERIIRRHGGKVWAESEPGSGATFYFTLSNGLD